MLVFLSGDLISFFFKSLYKVWNTSSIDHLRECSHRVNAKVWSQKQGFAKVPVNLNNYFEVCILSGAIVWQESILLMARLSAPSLSKPYRHCLPCIIPFPDGLWNMVEMLSLLTKLTLRPPRTTIVPYANSLDLDETPSNSASHPDPSCLTLRQHFHQLWATLKHFEDWSRREI